MEYKCEGSSGKYMKCDNGIWKHRGTCDHGKTCVENADNTISCHNEGKNNHIVCWRRSSLDVRQSGCAVQVRQSGGAVVWMCGSLKVWRCGSLEVRQRCGSLEVRQSGGAVVWGRGNYYGNLIFVYITFLKILLRLHQLGWFMKFGWRFIL